MKVLFWLSQVALVCSALYFSPLLSPVISNSWSMEEWSVRYGEYRDCIGLKRPGGHSSKVCDEPATKKRTGCRFLSFLTESMVKSLTTILRLLARIYDRRPPQLLGANSQSYRLLASSYKAFKGWGG